MKKILLATLTLLLASCTIYTEKQSEALSQNAYAANDSLKLSRVDLAYDYSDLVTQIVKAPKHRIDIKSIVENSTDTITNTSTNKQVVLLPASYTNKAIVTVGTKEYQELLKDAKIANQLKIDNNNLTTAKKNTEEELARQIENNNKMVIALNKLQKEVIAKDLVILRLWVVIGILALLIGGYIYLRVSKFIML
jgi:hypothetical protein